MTNPSSTPLDEIKPQLESLRARIRSLTVAMWVMALALFLTVAAVQGSLVNYFDGDALLFGGVSAGAAMLGFAFGWIARRRS